MPKKHFLDLEYGAPVEYRPAPGHDPVLAEFHHISLLNRWGAAERVIIGVGKGILNVQADKVRIV